MAQTPHPGAPPFQRKMIYIGAVVLLIALALWGLFAFTGIHRDASAGRKAGRLATQLKNAGLPVPSTKTLKNTFGDNGGTVCQNRGRALNKARLQAGLSNGATGPGSRPVIADRDIVKAEGLVIATYCPDRLGEFTKQINDLKFGGTVK